MADRTKISWSDSTWNFVVGCSHVSPGCEKCYAEALALRWGWSKKPWKAQNAKENIILKPDRLGIPLKWKEPRRVFVNSLSDLFHELIPFEFIDRAFDVMGQCPQHMFQIPTKRPERMREYMVHACASADGSCYPPPNVWLGTSVEDQRRADERIPILIDTPAAIRFLSCEPLLGPIDLYLNGRLEDGDFYGPYLDWVIVGGESGPKYRSMDIDWARSLRDQCSHAGVPFFFKQTSGPRPGLGEDSLGQVYQEFPRQ